MLQRTPACQVTDQLWITYTCLGRLSTGFICLWITIHRTRPKPLVLKVATLASTIAANMTGIKMPLDLPSPVTNLINNNGKSMNASAFCHNLWNEPDLEQAMRQMPLPCAMNLSIHKPGLEYGGLHQTRPTQGVIRPSSIILNERLAGIQGTPLAGAHTSISNSMPKAANIQGGV